MLAPRQLRYSELVKLLAVLVPVVLSLAISAQIKGGFLDEYWTIYFSDNDRRLSQALDLWTADTGHPIGFYAFVRSTYWLFPESLFSRRMLNLVPLILLTLIVCSENIRRDRFTTPFLLLFVGNYYAIERFAEHRSVFFGMCIVAALILVSRSLFEEKTSHRGTASAILGLSIALALMNYLAFGAGLAWLTACAVVLFAIGRRSAAVVPAIAAIGGILAASLSILIALRHPAVTIPYSSSMIDFARDVGGVVVRSGLANVALTVLALVALVKGWRDRPRWREALELLQRHAFVVAVVLAIGFTIIGYGAINWLTHAMIRRQILALVPLLSALIAVIAIQVPIGKRAGWAVYASLLLALLLATLALRNKQFFNFRGPEIAALQKACPGLPVYPLNPREAPLRGQATPALRDVNVASLGYRDVSERFGFTLASTRSPRTVDANCGAVFWGEHYWMDPKDPPTLVRQRLNMETAGQQTESSRISFDNGSLLVVIPGKKL